MQIRKEMLRALLSPESYIGDDFDGGPISLVETHMSLVYLHSHFVYKIKKKVKI
jgi:aminoglycoside phosphotransferase family enzyme